MKLPIASFVVSLRDRATRDVAGGVDIGGHEWADIFRNVKQRGDSYERH
jgi:hypothetical protein